jgi:hypothetical protein
MLNEGRKDRGTEILIKMVVVTNEGGEVSGYRERRVNEMKALRDPIG